MTKTNTFFESKQAYLAFRAAFAAAQNDLRSKKGKPDHNGHKVSGWLQPAHYMLMNLARGLPYDRGFTPITATRILENGCSNPNEACDWAKSCLEQRIGFAKEYLNPKDVESNWRNSKMSQTERNAARQKELLGYIRGFLEPIEDAFTINDLANLKFTPDA